MLLDGRVDEEEKKMRLWANKEGAGMSRDVTQANTCGRRQKRNAQNIE
jgi:hypothetical protein